MKMVTDEHERLYSAFKAKDTRFDGRFFVGISSTGIYCRPVCRAKQPKAENCTFYTTAAQAEQAGYRPCLLCRPELAPGKSITDATANLLQRATRLLEENCGSDQSLDELAEQLGCTSRHLRRVFMAEYQVTPVQYLQTCRLLLAKNLLTDTHLSVLEVAMASGFGSLRRFNDLFKNHYHLSPTALRKQVSDGKNQDGNIRLSLSYRPPYQWDQILNFLAGRAIAGVERVKDGEYWRTVSLLNANQQPVYGWLKVAHQPKKNALTVTLNEGLLPVLPQVLARIRHLFDLYCDPQVIDETLQSMNTIRPNLAVLGIRLPGSFNSFEMVVRAVLGQQISVKAASTLAMRFVHAYGIPIQTDIEGLTHVFPTPEMIVALDTPDTPIADQLGALGITSARSKTIFSLAQALVNDDIQLGLHAQPELEIKKLLTISGIGNWTAQYIAMRTMGYPDVFLETDAGIKKALADYTPAERLDLAEAWRPWRSYATINLWNSL